MVAALCKVGGMNLPTSRRNVRHLRKLLFGALMCLASGTLLAGPLDGIVKEANSFAPTNGVTLKKATEIARNERGGRVLSAKPYRRSGTIGYEVRLLIDGERVVNVIVDTDGRVRNKK
jgi:hypothetical protein